MTFSSISYVCIFLPLAICLYYIIPTIKAKNIILIFFSLIFYSAGEPKYLVLMVVETFINYLCALLIAKNQKLKKLYLFIAIGIDIILLIYFKYFTWLGTTINKTFGTDFIIKDIILPIGISFFTFQSISYVIDVYRDKELVQNKFQNVLLYITLFPQLVAGPIVKYDDFREQIYDRKHNIDDVCLGIKRFIVGLSKKLIIANTMAIVADKIFIQDVSNLNFLSAWLGALSYTFQIYFDFSGYSDMAIGIAGIFGFKFKDNFNYPFIANSIKDFWRRWHISLSTWFRDYIYIPLGGNRKGKARTILNKFVVFFVTGLWHGANFTFIIWGLFHGMFLVLEESLSNKLKIKIPIIIRRIYTLLIVIIAFVMFRANSVKQGFDMLRCMFMKFSIDRTNLSVFTMHLTPFYVIVFIIAIMSIVPVHKYITNKINDIKPVFLNNASYVFSMSLLVIDMLILASGTYNPFIYFRF